jgi:negative regulator of flagellin synthesis FlgM
MRAVTNYQVLVKAVDRAADNLGDRPKPGIEQQGRQGVMVSDIKGLNSRQTNGAGQVGTAAVGADARAARAGQADSAAPAEDSVELSSLPDVIKTTAAELAAQSSVDAARVRELKSAVANGSYQIDPVKIAKKLIDTDSL